MTATRSRVKTSTILQMEAAECGAAALAIILAYYGRYVSLEEMRIACAVSRDGCNALNIVKAARRYDMDAHGVKVETLEALTELKFPFIVYWEFNHFVVVEGQRDEHFYINDPATGHRRVSVEEFNKAFTGVVLLLKPTSNFVRGGQPASLYNSLKLRLLGSENDLLYIFLVSVALVIPTLVVAGLTKVFIDDIIISNIKGWILPLLTSLAITALIYGILTWMQQYYLLRVRIKLLLSATTTFLWHVLCLPMTFFQQRFVGDVVERVNANDRIARLLSNELSTGIISLFTMVFYAVFMLLLNWQLTLISIISLFINFGLLMFIATNFSDISGNFLQQRGRLSGIEMSGLRMIEDLKASSRENDFFLYWSGFHAKIISIQQKMAIYSQLLVVVPRLLIGLITIIVLGYGSFQIMQGFLSVGSLIAFQMLLMNFYAPLYSILNFGGSLQKIRGDLHRLDDVNQYPTDIRLKIEPISVRLLPTIQVKDLTFGYSLLAPPLMTDINLVVNQNERVAITGKTGSGKSTIAKLICGLVLPWQGDILLGNKPLSQIDQLTLSQFVGFIDQDVFLYEGTIRDNLTLWNKNIPLESIEKAITDACLEDVIAEKGGINAKVMEGGSNFSGGERQRLEIARALVNNPKILILDEATANLDLLTEKRIFDNLKKRDCTQIIITHRVSSIRDCDAIYHLEQGKLQSQP